MLGIKPSDGVLVMKGIAEGFGVSVVEDCGKSSVDA